MDELIFEVPFFLTILVFLTILSIFINFFKTKIDKFVFILFIYFSSGHLFITYILSSTYIYLKDVYSLLLFIYLYQLFKTEKIKLKSGYNKIIKFLFLTLIITTFIPFLFNPIVSFDAKGVFSAIRRSIPAINFLAIGYFTLKIGFNKELFHKLAILFLFIGLLIIIDGNLGYVLGLWKRYATLPGGNRLRTFYGSNPEFTTSFLTLGIISAYYILWRKEKKLFLLYFLSSIPIYIFAVTRSGYLVFTSAIFLLIISNFRRLFQLVIILIILVPLLIGIYSFTYSNFIEQRDVNPYAISTLENRFTRWEQLKNFIFYKSEIIVIGAGYNNWRRLIQHEYSIIAPGKIASSTLHNAFIDIMVENGILGIIFVFLYLINTFILILKGRFRNAEIIFASIFSLSVILMAMPFSWEDKGILIIPLYLLYFSNHFLKTVK